ncbi:MAG: adenosine kinase [Alphaproteobacteria bacterium]|nr:adenosine kinase [Alphaproteobacteria bacterium]
MIDKKHLAYDVCGIGNAIVDVLVHADDDFLAEHGLNKGAMALVNADQAVAIYTAMPPAIEVSGGSVANTMAGIASLGGKGAYVGKVRNDQLGGVFTHDLRSLGVAFKTPAAVDGPPTARCFVFITPDGQRTMNTYLGACVNLGPDDIDPTIIEASRVTYLEGYLWDSPPAVAAMRRAIGLARGAGRKVALSLSDSFCVDRHRDMLRALVDSEIDILFANEAEICSLFGVGQFDDALQAVRKRKITAALTRSAQGSVVVNEAEVHVIAAAPAPGVVDTTGAGDLYAAGFLYGLSRNLDLATCGRMGAIAAAEVIGHFGARPETPLAGLLAKQLNQNA